MKQNRQRFNHHLPANSSRAAFLQYGTYRRGVSKVSHRGLGSAARFVARDCPDLQVKGYPAAVKAHCCQRILWAYDRHHLHEQEVERA